MRCTALIVDDDEKIRKMLQFLLMAKGYKVELATDGISGLEAFKNMKPDIVLLDLMMPEMNGFEFYKRAKEDSCIKDIPILILTANLSNEVNRELDALGAENRMAKPFKSAKLLAALDTALDGKGKGVH
ncbi:MAG: response regulator [bacterium]|nr:response regulator [bacterium]